MAANDTTIVDLQVSNREAVAAIKQATEQIAELTQQEKELEKQRKKGEVTTEAYIKQLTQIREDTERAKQARSEYSKVLKDNIKQEQVYADSLNGLRAQLKKATVEYDNMSKAERSSAKGQELLAHIQDVTKELSEAEQATGRFQRQVGNYPAAFKGFEKYLPLLQGGIKGVTLNLAAMGKQLLKLLANPIVAVVAAVVVIFNKLRDAFKRNDDALTSLNKVFAAFKPVLDLIHKGIDAVVSVLGKLADGLSKAVTWVMKLIPALRDFADAEQDLVVATDNLEEAERQYTINTAKRSAEVSELKAKAADKEKYSAQERIAMLREAGDIEAQDLKESKAIAKERLRLAEEQAKVNSDTSDETKNNIAQLKAAVYQAEQAYNEGMRSIVRQTNAAVKEIAAEQEQARREAEQRRKAAAAAAKERRKTELAARQAVEDAMVAMMREGEEKQIELQRIATERKINELKTRLTEEKNLTKEARRLINEQIILAEAQGQLAIAKIQEDAERARYNARLDFEKNVQAALAAQEQQGEEARLLAYKNELDKRLQAAEGNAVETAEIQEREAKRELDVAKAKQAGILRINYETEEAYQLAMEKATEQVIEAQNKAAEATRATAAAIADVKASTLEAATGMADAFNSIAGNMQGLFETLAEEDSRYNAYAQAMAYLQILVSTAVSIANAIQGATAAAASTGVAAPFTLPTFIAEMVGIVTGAIAQATTLMMKSKKTPKYAEGGYVSGAGTGTSDSIHARLSNGESVMTAKATSMFYDQLSAMNVAGGGRPFDKRGGNKFAQGGVVSTQTIVSGRQTRELALAMSEAIENLHPVVSVREITQVQNRIQTKENIAKS